jgi:hypothetical protein
VPAAGRTIVRARRSALAAPADAPPQVVCTLGPKSRDVPVLEELLRAGMSVARFNFSHGSHEYHKARRGGGGGGLRAQKAARVAARAAANLGGRARAGQQGPAAGASCDGGGGLVPPLPLRQVSCSWTRLARHLPRIAPTAVARRERTRGAPNRRRRLLRHLYRSPLSPPQETLDNLRQAMTNTRIMCAVMLDTKARARPLAA